jgi:hypothetical protein
MLREKGSRTSFLIGRQKTGACERKGQTFSGLSTAMKNYLQLILFVFVVSLAAGSGSKGNSADSNPPSRSTRSFYMGFTPWPYDAIVSATTDTYARIQDNGDIVSHHLMSGIPWEASYRGAPLPGGVEDDLAARTSQTRSEKAVYLSIDSLTASRDGCPPNWGDSGGDPDRHRGIRETSMIQRLPKPAVTSYFA